MKNERLPPRWLALHKGDMIVSKVPLHRMERYKEAAAEQGYELRFEPCDAGYFVVCDASPHSDRSAA